MRLPEIVAPQRLRDGCMIGSSSRREHRARQHRMVRSCALPVAVFVAAIGVAGCGDDAETAFSTPPVDAPAGECSLVTYTPPSARRPMNAILCRPEAGEERFGGVVLVHGGGGTGGTALDAAAWEAAYRAAGLATLSIEYWLHDPSSGTAAWPTPESNAKAAVQFLRMHDGELGLDGNVFLHGWSAGARLGGVVATTPGDSSFPSDELWPGVSDDITSFIGWYGYYDGHQFDEDTYYENGEIPPAAIAINNVAAVTGPVQLTHGEDDPVVPVEQSIEFADALAEAGKEVNLNVVSNASSHVFDGYGENEITPAGASAAEEMVAWYESLMEAG